MTTAARRRNRDGTEPGQRGGRPAEYNRFGALLAGLSPAEWALPTVCPPWDVRLLAVRATEANAARPELLCHGRRGLAVDVDPVSTRCRSASADT